MKYVSSLKICYHNNYGINKFFKPKIMQADISEEKSNKHLSQQNMLQVQKDLQL